MNQHITPSHNIGTLTEQQQIRVLEFMAVTNMQDLDKAVLFMRNCDFEPNVIIFLFTFFMTATNRQQFKHFLRERTLLRCITTTLHHIMQALIVIKTDILFRNFSSIGFFEGSAQRQNIPLEENKGEPNHVRELKESFKKHYMKKKKHEEDSKLTRESAL